MNRVMAGCFILSLSSWTPVSLSQPNSDKTLETLYDHGMRELAPNWRGLGKTHESAVFIHQDVRKSGNGLLAVWTHHELPAAGYIEKENAYLSMRSRSVVDCKALQVGTTDAAYYSDRFGFGAVVWSTRKKPDMMEIVPDSIEELLVKAVCNSKTRREAQKTKSSQPAKG